MKAAPAATPPGDPAAPGKLKLPGYEIIDLLGKGGMGSVYKARQKSLDRIVALKVLSPDIARDETYLKRFTTEARALARLNHENIIAGIDVGEANGYRYFAMEYVEGESLAAVIESEGAIAEKRALTIAMQIARALVHADKNSLVHRDVKPQNIMIGRNDVAKLCDLGLAMTAEERKEARERGQSIGTPHYISPEQARGEHHVDIRSDIYSLGATLYHAVTGETPFTGTSPMVLMTKHLTEDPVPPRKRNPKVSRPLNDLVLKMMAKEKDRRYQTPIELLEDMERVLAGRGIEGGGRGGREAAEGKSNGGARSGRGVKHAPHAAARGSAKAGAALGAKRRPISRDEEDRDGGDEEEDLEEERPRRPKKASPAIAGAIAFFLIAIGGLIAYLVISATENKPPPGPKPPSAEIERAAMESLENVRSAWRRDKDKHATLRYLEQITQTYPRTEGARLAAEDYKKIEKMPADVDAGNAGADEDAPAAPRRAPLGAKGGMSEADERAARAAGDERRGSKGNE